MSNPVAKFIAKAMTPPIRRQSYATLLECLIVIDHLKEDPDSVDPSQIDELQEDVEKLLDVLDPDTHPHHNLSHGPN
jgi:hypothetical protein